MTVPIQPVPVDAAILCMRAHLGGAPEVVASMIENVPAFELVGGFIALLEQAGCDAYGGIAQLDEELHKAFPRGQAS